MNEEAPSPPLPDVQEAELDAEKLKLYLGDVSEQAKGLTLKVKNAPNVSIEGVPSLLELKGLLNEKKLWGAQLKYTVNGEAWLDTLMVKEGVLRLIRIRQQ